MIDKGQASNLNEILNWTTPITHRQVTASIEWTFLSLNYPDRNDFYQMMVACTVARSNSKTPQAIQPNQFRLNFGGDKPISRAERDKRALQVRDERIAARGGLDRYTIMDAQGNIVRPALKPMRGESNVPKNPLLRSPSVAERNAFVERQRLIANQRRNDLRVRNPRSSYDGKG